MNLKRVEMLVLSQMEEVQLNFPADLMPAAVVMVEVNLWLVPPLTAVVEVKSVVASVVMVAEERDFEESLPALLVVEANLVSF